MEGERERERDGGRGETRGRVRQTRMEKVFAGKGDDAIRGSILKLTHVTFVLAHALSLHCVGTPSLSHGI